MVTEQSDTERVPSMLAVWQLRERVWRAGEDGYHLWPPRGGLWHLIYLSCLPVELVLWVLLYDGIQFFAHVGGERERVVLLLVCDMLRTRPSRMHWARLAIRTRSHARVGTDQGSL